MRRLARSILYLLRDVSMWPLRLRAHRLFSRALGSTEPIHSRTESPVIVIGMHRSGTTLVTRLLQDLGIAMGARQATETVEALFFRRRNELMFALAHATWDNPRALALALEEPHLRVAFAKTVAHNLGSLRSLRFAPPDALRRLMRGRNRVWGFKDPRSCITLPVWLEVFPAARVIHIVRDGNAVASSLVRRGETQLKKGYVDSLVSLDSTLCVNLWADYVLLAHKHCAAVDPIRFLEVRYESLLGAPKKEVGRLAAFLGLAVSDERVDKAASRIDKPRPAEPAAGHVSPKAREAFALYDYPNR